MEPILTHNEIIKQVQLYTDNLIEEFDADTERDEVIEALDECCDDLWGELVQYGYIGDYTVEDLVATSSECAIILQLAHESDCVETDTGLWEGLTYGVLASIAYFSLRNFLYSYLASKGYDTNDDFPFAEGE